MTFGQHIRSLRKAAGLNQTQLAKKLDISTTLVSNIERGQTLPPARRLAGMAEALGVSISELLPQALSVHSRLVTACRFPGVVAADTAVAIGDVEVGKETFLGHHVVLDGSHGKVRVGEHCTIGHGAIIVTSKRKVPGDVIIGDKVIVAPGATLFPPLEVPSKALVGFPRKREA